MIAMTVQPRTGGNLYRLLINKEYDLRKSNRGSFVRRAGKSRRKRDIWVHKKHSGWIMFQAGLKGSLSVTLQSKKENEDWQIFSSFLGLLRRDFAEQVSSISISFES